MLLPKYYPSHDACKIHLSKNLIGTCNVDKNKKNKNKKNKKKFADLEDHMQISIFPVIKRSHDHIMTVTSIEIDHEQPHPPPWIHYCW